MIDYFLGSPNIFGSAIDFSVNDFDPSLSPVHHVIVLTLSRSATVNTETSPQSEQVDEDKKFLKIKGRRRDKRHSLKISHNILTAIETSDVHSICSSVVDLLKK